MQPNAERINALLAEMTVEEKAGQLNLLHGVVDADRNSVRAGNVGGYIMGPPRWSDGDKFSWAEEVNGLQRIAVEESRLKIPLIIARDVIHGHRTVFPIPLGQAASFEPELVRRCAAMAALEASAQGVRWNYSPMVDIARDPRWGRIAEGYGEDPYLSSRMAEQVVKGYQGSSLSDPQTLAACAKHFVGYGAGGAGRDYAPADISDRTLHQVYLPSFFSSVKAGAASVMTAIHALNGTPLVIHSQLQLSILRETFGFKGLIVTDWGTIADLLVHRVVPTEEAAVIQALKAGAEMDMLSGLCVKHLPRLIKENLVSEELLNSAVRRILELKNKLGLFDNPYTDVSREKTQLLTAENRALAREAAQKAAVLLENRGGVLPISRDVKAIAVVGPLAEARAELLGTWALDGRAEDVVSVIEGIRAAVSPGTRVIGDGIFMDAALAHSQEAQVIVAAVGEHPTRSGEAASVTNVKLPPGQEDFIASLAEYGIPLIVVVFAGRPLEITKLRRYADAVLYCFHPGVEGGNAIADIIFGKVSPSAKLPSSFPRAAGQVPIYHAQCTTGRAPRLDVRYSSKFIDAPHTPLYPFGYGLTYSRFEITGSTLSSDKMKKDSPLQLSVTIENGGDKEATEVVQLFIRDEVRSITPPEWELKSFQRMPLLPGERKQITFIIRARDLAFWKEGKTWGAEAGEFVCRTIAGADFREVTFELEEDVIFDDYYL